jgi:hypothetical protein
MRGVSLVSPKIRAVFIGFQHYLYEARGMILAEVKGA